MENTELSYSDAFKKLKDITSKLEDGSIPLEDLSSTVKEANELIAICENKLKAIESEIETSKAA
jgi:exodeoxyribonuclease VII small subunit